MTDARCVGRGCGAEEGETRSAPTVATVAAARSSMGRHAEVREGALVLIEIHGTGHLDVLQIPAAWILLQDKGLPSSSM